MDRNEIYRLWLDSGVMNISEFARLYADQIGRSEDGVRAAVTRMKQQHGEIPPPPESVSILQPPIEDHSMTVNKFVEALLQGIENRHLIPSKETAVELSPPIPLPPHGPRREPAQEVDIRAAVVDIETTDLKATGYKGLLLCVCILPLKATEVEVYRLQFEDYWNDQRLVLEVCARLADFAIWIGHNASGFDANWLNTRLLAHGLPRMGPVHIYDTYQVAKDLKILSERKSLDFLCDFFSIDLGEAEIKTKIYPRAWHQVRSPHSADFEDQMAEIVDHCVRDVFMNRKLFNELWQPRLEQGNNSPLKKKW